MAVVIRMKKMGRTHRPFYRICAMDVRSPRHGRAIEELGTYDPMIPETDARVTLDAERIDYWLGVGAKPSDKVKVFIKKYGTRGTHLKQREEALVRLEQSRRRAPLRRPATVLAAGGSEATETQERPQPSEESTAEE